MDIILTIKKNYFFLGVLVCLYSCNIYKRIPEGSSVLVANQIDIKGQEKDLINDFFYKGDLYKILKQKPNKRIFGIPVSQHIWAFYVKKRNTEFTQFMATKVGQPPVIFDSSSLEISRIALENYYFNIGHFDNQVKVSFKTEKKKTKVVYEVYPNTPYKIRNIYVDNQTPLQREIVKDSPNTFIHRGDIFNIANFMKEIERITFAANDAGYYNFNKDFVRFKYDTFRKINELDVYTNILEETDSTNFQKYYLDSIYLFINTSNEQANINSHPTYNLKRLKFIQPLPKGYEEKFLEKFVYYTHDSFYSKGDVNKTIQRMSELSNFKLINSSVKLNPDKERHLDLVYSLTPYYKRKISFGQYVYNSTLGFIGAQPTITFLNRNLTHRADRLNLSISGAIEVNAYLNQNKNASGFISRTDLSLQGNYTIENFIVPLWFGKDKNFIYNRNTINANYTFSKRLGYYDIHNIGFSLSYDWSKKVTTNFSYSPISFGAILFPESAVSDEFKRTLELNPYLKLSFNNSFILGSNFSLGHIIALGRNKVNSLQFKTNFETAGNTVFLADKILRFSDGKNGININGIDVSQFLKSQFELVHSNKINTRTSLHSRVKFGMAFPYGNSRQLPYIKQFFIGGPLSLRAFQPRTIGPGLQNPGVYNSDTSTYTPDQTGNISLEFNSEYRFHIISFLKGALFVDAGNIWNSSSNFTTHNESIFKLDEFYKQFYVGGGLGLRIDLNYFIMRFDVGIPMRIPYLTKNDWVILDAKPLNGDWRNNNLIINFAVGYPF